MNKPRPPSYLLYIICWGRKSMVLMRAKVDNFSKKELEEWVKKSNNFIELAKNLGYISLTGNVNKVIKQRLDEYKIDYSHFSLIPSNLEKRTFENSFCKNSNASSSYIREHYKKDFTTEKTYYCSICGQKPFWNNKPLTLTLDHINGIHNDNRLENLRWVCPNCDRQLDTFGSKNKYKIKIKKNYCLKCGKEIFKTSQYCSQCAAINQRKVERPDRETFKKLVYDNSFTELGRQFHVSDTSIKKWCVAYKLPKLREDIKKYSFEEWMKL